MESLSDPMQGLQVQRESTAQQVARVLRRLILSRELEPGTYVREMTLAEQLSVSRNTVREATQLLVAEGLMTREMHRGARVTGLTSGDARDVFYVRRIIELAAIESVLEPADLAPLEAAVDDLRAAVADDDKARIVECDLTFHRALVALADSRRLRTLYASLQGETELCISQITNAYPDPSALIVEHEGLLELIRRQDWGATRHSLEEHLVDAEERMVGLIEQREGERAERPPPPA
jgi:DNA-binding GntR family transcriptional regulator